MASAESGRRRRRADLRAAQGGAGRATAPGSEPRPGIHEVSTGTAELVQDRTDPDLWTLWLNGVPSSPVHLGDPTLLDFEYLRWMADVLDVAWEPARPLDAVHLGAAACALPRYVEATRPGSRQVAVELDAELARLVREWFPLPRAPRLRLQVGDARERLATRPDAGADVVVRDVFAGDTTPVHLTTVEFARDVARVLRPEGLYLANVADRPPLRVLRAEVAAVAQVFSHVAVVAETALLRGRRYANAVVVAGHRALPLQPLSRRLAAGSVPTRLVDGADVAAMAVAGRARRDPASGGSGFSP